MHMHVSDGRSGAALHVELMKCDDGVTHPSNQPAAETAALNCQEDPRRLSASSHREYASPAS